MSLRTRLTIGSVCTLALAICAGLAAAYLVVRGQLRSEIDHSLERRADALVAIAQQAPVPASPLGPATITVPAPALGAAAGYVQFVDASGNVALATGESTRLPTRGAAAVASGRRAGFFSDATVAGTHVRIYVSRVDGQTAAEIARPLTEVDHSLARIRLLFILVSLAAGAGAVAITAVVARSILRPVERLTGASIEFSAEPRLAGRSIRISVGGVRAAMEVPSEFDIEPALAARRKRLDEVRAKLEQSERKLGNEQFLSKAKPEAVERERENHAELQRQELHLREELEQLERIE